MDVTRVKEIDKQSKGKIKVFGGIMGYESYLNGAIGWVSVPSNICLLYTSDAAATPYV